MPDPSQRSGVLISKGRKCVVTKAARTGFGDVNALIFKGLSRNTARGFVLTPQWPSCASPPAALGRATDLL